MIRSYLRVALRNLLRHRVSSIIIIGGLAIGLSSALLIGLFVHDELGYDAHHEHTDRLFRLVRSQSVMSSGPMAPALQSKMAGIDLAARIERQDDVLIRVPSGEQFVTPILFADSTYFRMFSHAFLRGTVSSALPNSESAVLTRSAAMTWFGSIDVIGEQLVLDNGGEATPFFVTGVIEDLPRRSHLHFDIMVSFEVIEASTNRIDNWTTNWLHTYAMASPGVHVDDLNERLQPFIHAEAGTELAPFRFQPVRDIHLGPTRSYEMEPQGNFRIVTSLALIALLVLIIASASFVSIMMSRASSRLQEIGMRRAVGAGRRQLMGQFLGESVLIVFLSGLAGWGVAVMGLPMLGELTGKTWTLDILSSMPVLSVYATGLLMIGFLAGAYPSFYLSSLNVTSALKGRLPARNHRLPVQSVSLVGQFAISMFLIVATIVIGKQMAFMEGEDLGFERDARLVVAMESGLMSESAESSRQQLSSLPGVQSLSFTNDVPGENVSDFLFKPEGESDTDAAVSLDTWFTDEYAVETLGLSVVDGRAFDAQIPTDRSGFMLNESAVRKLAANGLGDWSQPVGKQIDFMVPGADGWETVMTGPIIGVIKDFHYGSLHESIGPLAFIIAPQAWDTAVFKLDTNNFGDTISRIEATVASLGATRPFEFTFLDEKLESLYRSEKRMQKAAGLFSTLAIILACLGLFAQATHSVQERRREIGVRKVFGASVSGIARKFIGKYVLLVAIAMLVAIPVATGVLGQWLNGFAYGIELSPSVFITGALVTLALAVSSVLFQAVRAALTNPAVVLRGE